MRSLTQQEMRKIAEENPPPPPWIVHEGDPWKNMIEVYQFVSPDGLMVRLCSDSSARINTHHMGLAEWALRVRHIIKEARTKPAPVTLPDVSDLPGVEASTAYGAVRVILRGQPGIKAQRAWVYPPDSDAPIWHVREHEGDLARYFAGIVAERLNQQSSVSASPADT